MSEKTLPVESCQSLESLVKQMADEMAARMQLDVKMQELTRADNDLQKRVEAMEREQVDTLDLSRRLVDAEEKIIKLESDKKMLERDIALMQNENEAQDKLFIELSEEHAVLELSERRATEKIEQLEKEKAEAKRNMEEMETASERQKEILQDLLASKDRELMAKAEAMKQMAKFKNSERETMREIEQLETEAEAVEKMKGGWEMEKKCLKEQMEAREAELKAQVEAEKKAKEEVVELLKVKAEILMKEMGETVANATEENQKLVEKNEELQKRLERTEDMKVLSECFGILAAGNTVTKPPFVDRKNVKKRPSLSHRSLASVATSTAAIPMKVLKNEVDFNENKRDSEAGATNTATTATNSTAPRSAKMPLKNGIGQIDVGQNNMPVGSSATPTATGITKNPARSRPTFRKI